MRRTPTASADLAAVADSTDPPRHQTRRDWRRSRAGQQTTPHISRLEFQHVLVTNVQTTNAPVVPDETDQDDPTEDQIEQVSAQQYVVTLALSPEQSERFVFATEFGHVWLSNQPATVSDDGTRLVTLGNVYSVAK